MAFVPVTDTLWVADLKSGLVKKWNVRFDGYEPVHQPDRGQNFRDWITTLQRPTIPQFNDSGLVISYVNGALPNWDPTIRLVFADGEWITVTGGPPIIGHTRDLFVALENRPGAPITLGFYKLTP